MPICRVCRVDVATHNRGEQHCHGFIAKGKYIVVYKYINNMQFLLHTGQNEHKKDEVTKLQLRHQLPRM